MTLIRPFAALRPAPGRAAEVAAPPYDVLSSDEARALAAGKPWSFLHVSKAEIDLPPGTDPYAPEVYARAALNLRAMLDHGLLARDTQPCYYAYRAVMGAHKQTGLAAIASVAEYERNRIRRHELTRPEKEDDRVRQIEAVEAQTGPVLLAYPAARQVDAILAAQTQSAPDARVVDGNGVEHALWPIRETGTITALTQAFDAMPALYIADGHHRSAAAARVAAARRGGQPAGEGSAEYFLAVMFPHHQMRILDYNRVVADLGGLSVDEFLRQVGLRFRVEPSAAAVHPARRGEYGLYLPGRWYRLAIRPDLVPAADAVARLDVSLLTAQLLEPVMGIRDLRRDKRIDFVGGVRGLHELERLVDTGAMAAAFSLYPTSMEDLIAVADAGAIMPPKSTWFEPKLVDGLVSHVLDRWAPGS